MEGEVLSGEASSRPVRRLGTRLARDGLIPANAGEQGLSRALREMSHRLRVARGEYGGVP